jgi:hypothetical protein
MEHRERKDVEIEGRSGRRRRKWRRRQEIVG